MIEKSVFLKGFMLLAPSPVLGYRGIDRYPFEPMLVENDMARSVQIQDGETRIWAFYPPGWKQDAFRLYEENLIEECKDILSLLSTLEAGQEIQKIIEPHIGFHELVECEICSSDSIESIQEVKKANFIGYDLAYLGGDCYSAILNGLFINPHPELYNEFRQLLNRNLLFENAKIITRYLHCFKAVVPSEAYSEFWVYRLSETTAT